MISSEGTTASRVANRVENSLYWFTHQPAVFRFETLHWMAVTSKGHIGERSVCLSCTELHKNEAASKPQFDRTLQQHAARLNLHLELNTAHKASLMQY